MENCSNIKGNHKGKQRYRVHKIASEIPLIPFQDHRSTFYEPYLPTSTLLFIGGISFHIKADWQMTPSTPVSIAHTWSDPLKFITAGDSQKNSTHGMTTAVIVWHRPPYRIVWHMVFLFKLRDSPVFDIKISSLGENWSASFLLPLPHVNAHPWPQPIGDNAWLTLCPSLWDVNLVFLCWPPRSQEKTTVFQMTWL